MTTEKLERPKDLDSWAAEADPDALTYAVSAMRVAEYARYAKQLEAEKAELEEFRSHFPPLVNGEIARRMVEDRAKAEKVMERYAKVVELEARIAKADAEGDRARAQAQTSGRATDTTSIKRMQKFLRGEGS